MEDIDKQTKKYFADYEKEVRKLRRKSGGKGAKNEQLVTLISAMAETLVGHSHPDDKALLHGLMAVEDAGKEIKKTEPWLESFSKLFVHVHANSVLRVGSGYVGGESSRQSTPSTSPLPPPKKRGRKSSRQSSPSNSPVPPPKRRGRKSGLSETSASGGRKSVLQKMVESQTTDGETDTDLGENPSGRPRRRAKEAAKAKMTTSRPGNRRTSQSSVNESLEENWENEENEEKEEPKIRRIETNLISPRTKKAKESLENRVEEGFKTPHHRVKAEDNSWPCAGLRGKCSESFSSHADLYQHMLKEHYLEGPVMGKCDFCKFIAPFAEVIVHRKEGDQFLCGDEDTVMKYWIELERKKEDETKDEKEEREKVSQLAESLRKCMYKNCEGPSKKTYEGLEEHNREAHQITVQYVCMREGCGHTFLHPLAFIRHMNDTCITGVPKIMVKKVKERKIKEEEEEEGESQEDEEESEEEKSEWESMDDASDEE